MLGFDLKQIFVGSEGTLGIITAATFRIYKKPNNRSIIWIGTNKISKVLKIYSLLTKVFCDLISSFELMNKKSLTILQKIGLNFQITKEYYCLIELSNFPETTKFPRVYNEQI